MSWLAPSRPRTLAGLVLRYGAFAVLATIANLGAQRLALMLAPGLVPGWAAFGAALVGGTGAGLVVKYLLDKRWIFADTSRGLAAHGRRFGLYTLMGLGTTAIFWGTETAFWLAWGTERAREAGAVLGLAVGYTIKYFLDRAWVFTPGEGFAPEDRGPGGRGALWAGVAVLAWAAALALTVWRALADTGGRFVYAIDDPYIHLALAEQILGGTWGVNAGEPAAVASSVLWPLLTAAALALGAGDLGPFALAAAASGASVWLVARIWAGEVLPAQAGPGTRAAAAAALVPVLFLLNPIALPMTGMEHSAHLLACLLVLWGLWRTARAEAGAAAAPAWLVAAIALAPLLRFEGVVLAGAAVLALGWLGRWRAALLSAGLAAAGLGLWALAMSRLGLPPLPGSVTLKSAVAAGAAGGGGLVSALVEGVRVSMFNRFGVLIALGLAALLAAADRGARGPALVVAAVAGAVGAAHLVAGHYDRFARYEVYAVASVLAAGLLVHARALGALLAGPWGGRAALLAAALVAALPYMTVSRAAALAPGGIHRQQGQMHRFATEYLRGPVAVNDLGRVAYGNPFPVLDLWGLGTEEMRRARAAGRADAAFLAGLAARRGVALAMIYDRWFEGRVPPAWCRIGRLVAPARSADEPEVAFYATDPARLPELRAALDRFAPTLLPGTRFEAEPCPGEVLP